MRTRQIFSSSNPVPPRPAEAHSAKGAQKPHDAEALRGRHRSVLLHEAVEALDVRTDDIVVDATLGVAGHAKSIAKKLGRGGLLIGFDLDSDAVDRATSEEILSPAGRTYDRAEKDRPRIVLINANFRDLKTELQKREIKSIDKALFDLGWSSDQLSAGRGFSFLKDEPLLMTYAAHPGANELTAATIVNEWSESSLADIIYGWGEERYSRRIAKAIVEHRQKKPFETSLELSEVIRAATPPRYRRGRIHPATRTFQALRIAVNDELGALTKGLRAAWEMLAPGGRIAVITFHSIEDRIVKRMFLEFEKSGRGERVTKKPIVPSMEELKINPRARSGKLRVIESRRKRRDPD